ncbi:MAG: rod shape-determining protein RodA [Bacteroidales bacterium]
MIERRLYFHVDWLLLGAILLLAGIGVAMIYSITGDPTRGASMSRLYMTQIYAIAIGVVALLVCMTIDYRTLADSSHIFYVIVIALLIYTLFFGSVVFGSRRWIPLKFFNLQSSEFAKLALTLVLAKFFDESRRGNPAWNDLFIGAGMSIVPFLLVYKEPDLGTAVTLLPIFLGIAYLSGLRTRILGVLLLVFVVSAPIAWKFALKDYQRSRISAFIDPSQDPQGAGYQQIQARVAVGSGGVWGKGFRKGTQGQLQFLPVAHNDFIFSVLAEEQGLAGVLAALGLYLFVILRALDTARLSKDRLGSYLVIGVLSSFTFQVLYNVAMSAGLAPVKGLTLPLMSYGGSSMIATLAGFGLILNVRMRRFTN